MLQRSNDDDFPHVGCCTFSWSSHCGCSNRFCLTFSVWSYCTILLVYRLCRSWPIFTFCTQHTTVLFYLLTSKRRRWIRGSGKRGSGNLEEKNMESKRFNNLLLTVLTENTLSRILICSAVFAQRSPVQSRDGWKDWETRQTFHAFDAVR